MSDKAFLAEPPMTLRRDKLLFAFLPPELGTVFCCPSMNAGCGSLSYS